MKKQMEPLFDEELEKVIPVLKPLKTLLKKHGSALEPAWGVFNGSKETVLTLQIKVITGKKSGVTAFLSALERS